MLGYQNTKDLNEPGVFLGKPSHNWIPGFNSKDDSGKPQLSVEFDKTKKYYIEGVYNGFPIRQEVIF